MRFRTVLLIPIAVAALVLSCNLPSLSDLSSTTTSTKTGSPTVTPGGDTGGSSGGSTSSSGSGNGGPNTTAGTASSGFSLYTDATRNVGVLLTPDGSRIDISASNLTGAPALCAAPKRLVPFKDDSSKGGGSGGDSMVILGKGGSGGSGIWIYAGDKKIEAPIIEKIGKPSVEPPESEEHKGELSKYFGWTYYFTGVSEDGRILVGYAENTKGFKRGKYTIDPGTTIGLYWRISRQHDYHHHRRYVISSAHVIGTFEPPTSGKGHSRHFRHGMGAHIVHKLRGLAFFFLDYLSAYLTTVDENGVSYDKAEHVYRITGTDQDGNPAVATLDRRGTITIAELPPQQQQVDLAAGAISYSGAPVAENGSFTVNMVVQNLGATAVSQSFDIDFYLAQGPTFNPVPGGDQLVDTTTVSGVPANGSKDFTSLTLSMPSPVTDVNQTLYLYAVVDPTNTTGDVDMANNVSTPADAPILLVYRPGTARYYVTVETYLGSGGTATTTQVLAALYRDNEDPPNNTMTWITNANLPPVSSYAVFNYTSTGLAPGKYYIAVEAVGGTSGAGPYAVNVRTVNLPQVRVADQTGNVGTSNDNNPALSNPPSNLGGHTVPVSPLPFEPGNAVSWYMDGNATDWFTFTLP